jgi:hypothetical protein
MSLLKDNLLKETCIPSADPIGEHDVGLDLVWGVSAIAKELNLSSRQTYHQLETGTLPARKHCGKWVASRSGLRKFFAALVEGEVA